MIQDISLKFNNSYSKKEPKDDSIILFYRDKDILIKKDREKGAFLKYSEIKDEKGEYTYLFSIDSTDYFLSEGSNLDEKLIDCEMKNVRSLRELRPKHLAFAGLTGYQLYNWYKNNKFCGRCGHELEKDNKERMLHCSNCNNMIYPKICPAVIVAVTDGDRLLMTKYASGVIKSYNLVAGFTEIGETLEETAKREVMEEVGLKVKNIRYYKSQPWSLTDTILTGFVAEVGDTNVTIYTEELSVAHWIHRDDITTEFDDFSLTNEMIMKFKNNELV